MSGAVGSTVTITGSNFVNVSSVTFYDYPSPSFTVVSPTQITAVVPAGTPSPGRWRVVTAAGTAVYDPLFTVTGTPTITGVSPMSGPVGSTVTISGSNFVNVTKVSFYDYPSPSFTVVSPTQITAIVPAGTPSPGRWRVVNPAYSAVYNPLFTVTGTPAITGVSPMSGPVGSTVTISGSNFVNVTKVSFYDYPSPSFTVVSPTQITAVVPAGTPSPGRWRVVNPAYSAVYDPLFTVTRTPGRVVMDEDLGWAPVPPANLPWNALTQLILFNLETQAGPGLDTRNIANINVPVWVSHVHEHPGIKAIIAIGGSDDNTWGSACNDTNRPQFVRNLVGFATSNGFDGVDLDIEDGPLMAQGPPSPTMTTCIQAISTAAHAAGLYVSADVITNWQGPWYAPSQAYVDQFNLMTFGDNLATMKADVAATISQGLPASKFVVGVDVDDFPQPAGGCGQFSSYAAQAGLMGSFVWQAASDTGNVCANGLAAGR